MADNLVGNNEKNSDPPIKDIGITTFADDGEGDVSRPVAMVRASAIYSKLSNVPGADTLQDFFRRPTRVRTGSLASTDSGVMWKDDPWVVLSNSTKSSKLTGVYMTRFKAVVTLQINANRFQQGRYIMAFMPSGGNTVVQQQYLVSYRMHVANLTTISQLPHVEIDLSCQTKAVLEIPFSSVFTGYTYNASFLQQNMGYVFLIPYVPLATAAGSTTCNYSVWMHMEEVETMGAAVNQSAEEIERKEGVNMGPISGLMSRVGSVATILGNVPALAPQMGTLKWMSDLIGQAAHTMGWSKAVSLGQPQKYHRLLLPYIGNTDQPSMSQPIGYVSTNEVPQNVGVTTTQIDEMSFDFIKQQYAYYNTVTWNTSAVVDATLVNVGHTGLATVNVGKGFVPMPFAAVSHRFRYWRGGLRLRIKVVGTEFHSGRLLFCYNPTFRNNILASTSELNYRVVIDIRETKEFVLEIPYVSPELWTERGVAVGNLAGYVLDPLVCPATVSSYVSLIMELAASEDFEVAYPDESPWWEPYAPAVSQAGVESVGVFDFGIPKISRSLVPFEVCMGEKLTSVRQMLKRITNTTILKDFSALSYSWWLYIPYMWGFVDQATSNSGALRRGVYQCDEIDYYSNFYLYSTGGMRVIVSPNFDQEHQVYMTTPVTNQDRLNGQSTRTPDDGQLRVLTKTNIEGFIDVTLPSYNRLAARVNTMQLGNENAATVLTASVARGAALNGIVVGPSTTPGLPYVFRRAAADDFNMFGWLGTIPFVLSTAT